MIRDFDIRIGQDITRGGLAIVIWDKRHKENSVLNLYTGESKVIGALEQIPDEFIMRLSNLVAQDFLQALAEALDDRGIKTDKDAKIQGTLEATEYHLEDLRSLLKLPTEINLTRRAP